jgi:hypothetical protein
MAKPQQPEIARSGHSAADPGAVKSSLSAPTEQADDPARGPVPEENLPGHHPEQDQDKPTGDAFLQKLHEHAQSVEDDEPPPTAAGDALRAAAGAVRKVREALPGDGQ